MRCAGERGEQEEKARNGRKNEREAATSAGEGERERKRRRRRGENMRAALGVGESRERANERNERTTSDVASRALGSYERGARRRGGRRAGRETEGDCASPGPAIAVSVARSFVAPPVNARARASPTGRRALSDATIRCILVEPIKISRRSDTTDSANVSYARYTRLRRRFCRLRARPCIVDASRALRGLLSGSDYTS